jgi:hypothetical protein
MAPRKPLRVVTESDAPVEPPTLLEAVESGDILAIMKAQRRIIAESLTKAAENTRPQFSNELNKLNGLIREEESRRSVEDEDTSVVATLEAQPWNGTGY